MSVANKPRPNPEPSVPSNSFNQVRPENMHSRVPTAREHAQGVILVVAVSLIWVLGAVFIQYILSLYRKPYLIALTACSCFALFLPTFLFNPSSHAQLRQNLAFSASLAPFFFVTCYLYHVGLVLTSIASSATISTLTTLFSLGIGALVGTEPFTVARVVATAMTIAGVAIVGSDDGAHKVIGDVLSLISSFAYAVYGIMLKHRSTHGGINIRQVQGLMGVICLLVFCPILPVLHYTGVEKFELPTPKIAMMVMLNGLLGTVLTEFLFAKSVVLTSPMVSSLAISLTVPFSLIADRLVKKFQYSSAYLSGTVLVLAAFFLCNWDMHRLIKETNDVTIVEERQPLLQIETGMTDQPAGGAQSRDGVSAKRLNP